MLVAWCLAASALVACVGCGASEQGSECSPDAEPCAAAEGPGGASNITGDDSAAGSGGSGGTTLGGGAVGGSTPTGGSSPGSGGTGGQPCTPLTKPQACQQSGNECGEVPNGCGLTIDCGPCYGNGDGRTVFECGPGNKCQKAACQPLTWVEACDGLECGEVSDGCSWKYRCGTSATYCDDATSVCGPDNFCYLDEDRFCESKNYECGTHVGPRNSVSCGTCDDAECGLVSPGQCSPCVAFPGDDRCTEPGAPIVFGHCSESPGTGCEKVPAAQDWYYGHTWCCPETTPNPRCVEMPTPGCALIPGYTRAYSGCATAPEPGCAETNISGMWCCP